MRYKVQIQKKKLVLTPLKDGQPDEANRLGPFDVAGPIATYAQCTAAIEALIEEKEFFLSFENFLWFKDASVAAIQNVEVLNEHHLYWPDLDIDLAVESIEHPERFPLVAQ